MASTRKLTKALTRPLTRKLTGDELEQLFLEKFKLILGSELVTNGNFSNTDGSSNTIANWTGTGSSLENGKLKLTVTGGGYVFAFQPISYETGSTYQVSFTVNGTSGKIMRCRDDGGDSGGLTLNNGTVTLDGTDQQIKFTFVATSGSDEIIFERQSGGDYSFTVDNVSLKKVFNQAPFAAFSLRKLGNISPYACRVRRSSDNTEAQVMFDSSDRVSESSVVRNTSANLLSFSEQLNNSAWSNNQGGTATLSNVTDPFGGNNSYEVSGGSQPFGGIYDTITGLLTTGKNYVYSIYLKKGTSTKTKISYYDSTLVDGYATSLRLTINWASDGEGTINAGETSTADLIATSFEEIGTDGWYRASIAFTALDTNDVQTLTIEPDRTGNGKTVLAFGAMLEEATTYEAVGTEKITDGGFDDANQWAKSSSITIASSKAAFISSAENDFLQQNIGAVNGRKYKVTVTVTAYTAGGAIAVRYPINKTASVHHINSVGTHTIEGVADQNNVNIQFQAKGTSTTLTIDNLSVTEHKPIPSEYISTPVVSNDGLTFVESTLDDFVGGENHLPRSQDFDNWNQVGGSQTIVENHVNHLGESTASLITTSATGARIEKTISIVAGQTYVASVWVKRYNSSRFEMYVLQGGPSYAPQGYIRANISSSDGSLSTHENHGNTSEITYTDFGEGWYRASFKFTATSDDTSAVFRLRADIVDGDKGTYFFGAQLNKDSLKDYQKTEATARDGRASIVTLYNAVGGEDAHQATQTDQPLLYHRGLLVRDGASPAMLFTQTQRKHLNLQNLSLLTTGHIFAVLSVTNDPPDGSAAQGSNRLWELGTGGNSHHPFAHASTSTVAHSFGSDTRKSGLDLSSLNLENKHLLTIKSKTNDWHMRINGVSKQTASTNTVAFPSAPFIGSDTSVFGGKYSEIILFDSDQDSKIDAIQSDIADFHNITLL